MSVAQKPRSRFPIYLFLALLVLGVTAYGVYYSTRAPKTGTAALAEVTPAPPELDEIATDRPEGWDGNDDRAVSEPSRNWNEADRANMEKRVEFMMTMMGLSNEEQAALQQRMDLFRKLDDDQKKMVGDAFRSAFSGELKVQLTNLRESVHSGRVGISDMAQLYRDSDGIGTADNLLLAAETYDTEGLNNAIQNGYGVFFDRANVLAIEREATGEKAAPNPLDGFRGGRGRQESNDQ